MTRADIERSPGQHRGTVYGVLLNDRRTLERLAAEFVEPPYKAPPRAPVLYIKPRNTQVAGGAAVVVPSSAAGLRIEATVGAVIGERASHVKAGVALSHVRGYAIVSDVSVPHEKFYRPSIPYRCRDGFCPIGEEVPAGRFDPAKASVSVAINGRQVLQRGFADMVRPLPELLAEMTAFMTLEAGDMVLLGLFDQSPVAAAGDSIRIEVEGLGALDHTLVASTGRGEAR